MEELEFNVRRLHRKFNLLCNWLQIKFPDDSTFPRSLVLALTVGLSDAEDDAEADKESYISDDGVEFTEEESISFSFPDDEDFLSSDLDPLATTVEEVGQLEKSELCTGFSGLQRSALKLAPCFINLERLKDESSSVTECTVSSAEQNQTCPQQREIILGSMKDDDIKQESYQNPDRMESVLTVPTEVDPLESSVASKADPSNSNVSQNHSNKVDMKKQIFPKKSGISIPCPFCEQRYVRQYIFPHIRRYHAEKATWDALRKFRESLQAKAKTEIVRISTRRRSNTIHRCPICQRKLKTLIGYSFHLKNYHPDIYKDKLESGEIQECDKSAKEQYETAQCSFCSKLFKRTNLQSHIQTAHGNKESFLCSECGYKTNNRHALDTHMHIHSEERKFKCTECPFAAKQYEGVRIHFIRMHNPAKLMKQCFLCGEFFKGASNLKRHISRVHNNERPYGCPFCEKSFKEKGHLDYHVKTHDNPNGRKRGLNKERMAKKRKGSDLPIPQTSTSASEKKLSDFRQPSSNAT